MANIGNKTTKKMNEINKLAKRISEMFDGVSTEHALNALNVWNDMSNRKERLINVFDQLSETLKNMDSEIKEDINRQDVIESLQDAKQELQHRIKRQVKQFESETGLEVEDILIDRIDLDTLGSKQDSIFEIDVSVKLPDD